MATVIANEYALIDGGDGAGLKNAIVAANNNAPYPYNIFLNDGIYNIDSTIVVFGHVRIYGEGVDVSVIRQDPLSTGMAGIFTLNGTATLRFHNLTIKDGSAEKPLFGAVTGGGIKIWSGTLYSEDVKWEDNIAESQGGAIYNIAGQVDIKRTIFSGNRGMNGGAIYTLSTLNPTLTVEHTRFTGNHVDDMGGAIAVSGNMAVEIHNSSFLADNTAVSAFPHILNDPPTPAIDASSNYWAPSPQVSLGVNTTPTLGSDPVATMPVIDPIEKLLTEIGDYGVIIYREGLDISDPNYGSRRPWTLDELRQLLIGIQMIGRAFSLLKGSPTAPSGTVAAAKLLFQTIMGAIQLRRVENGYTVSSSPCNGTTNQACTDNNNAIMVFYGNVDVNHYTVIHEFGHRFNNQSGGSYEAQMDAGAFVIKGCGLDGIPSGDDDIVMGHTGGIQWERGRRGWGSGPGQSTFQQHFVEDPGKTQNEITEAAADMFLNWVYRRNTGPAPTGAPCSMPATGTWEGFLNTDWLSDPDGADDHTRKPGNARYQWMENTLSAIFTTQGW